MRSLFRNLALAFCVLVVGSASAGPAIKIAEAQRREIKLPSDFGWQNPGFKLFVTGERLTTDFNPQTTKPACQQTVYASLSGNNNNTAAFGSPVRSMRLALAIANAQAVASGGTITVTCLSPSPGRYRSTNTQARSGQPTLNGTYTDSWISENPTTDLVIVPTSPGQVVNFIDVALPAFSLSACPGGNIYSMTYGAQTPSRAMIDLNNLGSDGRPIRLAQVITVAVPSLPCTEVDAQWAAFPGFGSVYLDFTGKTFWVRTYNNAAPGTNIVNIGTSNSLRIPAKTDPKLWVQNWESWSGPSLTNVTGGAFTFTYVDSFFGFGTGNGLSVSGNFAYTSYCIRSAANFNDQDGFNYHGKSDGTVAQRFFEFGCTAIWNGWDYGGTNNGSTAHEYIMGIRGLGDYRYNADRSIHDINHAQTYIVKSIAGPSWNPAASPHANYVSGVADGEVTKMWLDGDLSVPGSTYDLYVWSGSSIKRVNMKPMVSGGTGTLTNYLRQ